MLPSEHRRARRPGATVLRMNLDLLRRIADEENQFSARPHAPEDDERMATLVEDLRVLEARGFVEKVRTLDNVMSARRGYYTAVAFITPAGRRTAAALVDPISFRDHEPTPLMADVDKKREQRYQLLSALYDRDEQAPNAPTHDTALGASLGLTAAETASISTYLADEGLIETIGSLGSETIVRIAHRGKREVESTRAEPAQPTEHFPANVSNVTIHVETMNNSQIVQGSSGSSQSLSVGTHDLDALRTFVAGFRESLPKTDLPAAVKSQATAEIATIEAQLGSPSPRRRTIGDSLQELRAIVEGAAAGTALAAAYLPQLQPLLDRWAS